MISRSALGNTLRPADERVIVGVEWQPVRCRCKSNDIVADERREIVKSDRVILL